MISKYEIEQNKIFKIIGKVTSENFNSIKDYISNELERYYAKKISPIALISYSAFWKNNYSNEFILSKLDNFFYIYINTRLDKDISKFLNRYVDYINKLSIRERMINYKHLLTRERFSTKGTTKKGIIIDMYELGRRVNEQIIYNKNPLINNQDSVEIIIPVNVDRLWEFRLYYSKLKFSENHINEIIDWHKKNNYKYSEIIGKVIETIKNDKSIDNNMYLELLTDKDFLETFINGNC